MNWQLFFLDEAWQKRPRGGDSPCVIHPSSIEWRLSVEEMREQLEETARHDRSEAEQAFAQWASTGRWSRLKRHSGWLIREILSLARSEAENGRSSWGIAGETQDPSARQAAVFRAWSKRWFDTELRLWAQEEAEREHEICRMQGFG